jgi:hypothetical protein
MTKVVKNRDLAPKTGLILRKVGEGDGRNIAKNGKIGIRFGQVRTKCYFCFLN